MIKKGQLTVCIALLAISTFVPAIVANALVSRCEARVTLAVGWRSGGPLSADDHRGLRTTQTNSVAVSSNGCRSTAPLEVAS